MILQRVAEAGLRQPVLRLRRTIQGRQHPGAGQTAAALCARTQTIRCRQVMSSYASLCMLRIYYIHNVCIYVVSCKCLTKIT